ncbi:MAG: hypothetical protein NVS3B2_02260 [Ramlibacter sp.]
MVGRATGKPVWLFVSYGGGHVKALLPVAERVRELGIAQPMYLALTTARSLVKRRGLPTLGFSDFLAADDLRAREMGKTLAAQLPVQVADREESIAYLGLSYVDLEDRVGITEAAARYGRYGRQAFLPLGILERILREHRPALVVATNSPRAEQAAIETAGAMGIASVCVVDLLGIWERELLAKPGYASALCVLNEGVRRSMVGAGRPAGDVHVTGNPAFDSVNDPALKAQGRHVREQAGWNDLHVLLYASSPEPVSIPGIAPIGNPAFPRQIEQVLVRAVSDNPGLALWIRRHPSEPLATHLVASGHPRIRVSTPEMPLHACIHASDEIIVTGSTVGVEATLAGKSVTQIRGSILDDLSPYVALGLAARELTVRELAAAYAPAAVNLPAAPDAAGFVDSGRAADRVVRVLQSVAGPLP